MDHERRHDDPNFPGIGLAPTFHPTEEEFADPMEYIRLIKPTAERFGICRIVVPAGFRDAAAEFFAKHVDRQKFRFLTKYQSIHQLQRRQGPCEIFMTQLEEFLKSRGEELIAPRVDCKEIDFYRLFFEVQERGGYEKVCQKKLWRDVARALKLSETAVHAAYQLSRHYASYLLAFEKHYKKRKHGTTSSVDTIVCEICKKGDHEDQTLLCDAETCGRGYHMFCLKPPLTSVPKGEWLCPMCIEEDKDFGFADGQTFNLDSYERMASNFSKKYWAHLGREPTPAEIEQQYWHIVESAEENVQVHYGSDVDVKKHGSLFPTKKTHPEHPLSSHGWNPNNLARVPGSVLQFLGDETPGVTHPMIYVGMLFSTFCWHNEDNHLYSINYLVAGAPKMWYGVPGSCTAQFEKVMRETFPTLFASHRDLLYHLVTMMSPAALIQNKVPVEVGHLMITFPAAYHAGFNTGFNLAESVNFAPGDWLPQGRDAVARYQLYKRLSAFSHEQLVCDAARQWPLRPLVAHCLAQELALIVEQENSRREKLLLEGITHALMDETADRALTDEQHQCVSCRFDCYMSYVVCPCRPTSVACPLHYNDLCKHSTRSLVMRYTMLQLCTMLETLRLRVKMLKLEPLPAKLPPAKFDFNSHRLREPLVTMPLPPPPTPPRPPVVHMTRQATALGAAPQGSNANASSSGSPAQLEELSSSSPSKGSLPQHGPPRKKFASAAVSSPVIQID